MLEPQPCALTLFVGNAAVCFVCGSRRSVAREQLEVDLAAADAASPAPSPLPPSNEAEAAESQSAAAAARDPREPVEVASQPELADTGTGIEVRDGTVTPPAMEPSPEAPLSPSIAETLSDPKRKVSWA